MLAVWGVVSLAKLSDSYFTGSRNALFVKFNPLDFMKSLCFKIALPTVRAGYDGNVLDDEHILSLAVGSCNPPNTRTLFSTDFTYHFIYSIHVHGT